MLDAMTPPAGPGPIARERDHPPGPHRAPDAAGAGDVVLTGADLTIDDVEAVARGGTPARLDVHARARMDEARAVVERLVAAGEVVYGITTGFGDLATTYIPPADARQLQENLLVSHAVGVGAPLPRDVVRAMLLLRANTLALGHSGCRPVLVDRLLAFLEAGIHPVVPSQGSVGASGDLAPLAHLALPLIGRGEVEMGGQVKPALVALRETGIEPLVLEAKEGLALAAELRHLLRDSSLMASHHGSGHKVQDPYSLRCVPQVHGAVRDALDYLRRVLDVELNSATDNPLVFPEGGATGADVAATGGGLVISGGNFHGEPIALALDFAKLAIAELGAISERRIALLVDARLNGGLPPFLAAASGLNSGMMILQYTAAALASENKVLAHPASADSIPTSANQEDHVSMGAIAGRHARDVLSNVEQILALELLVGAQALDLRLAMAPASPATIGGPGAAQVPPRARREPGTAPASQLAPGRGVAEAHRRIRSAIAPLLVDREMSADIAAALALVRGGALADLVDAPDAGGPGAG